MATRGPKPKDSIPSSAYSGRMIAPSDLDDVGKQAWEKVVADLRTTGTLHKTDTQLIALYARTYSLFNRTELELANATLTIDSSGMVRLHPLANLYSTLVPRLRQILSDLGLSPKTRKVNETEEIDPKWANF